MACAGYLVVNAAQLVMAEMRHDGRLVCRAVDTSRLSKHRRRRQDDKQQSQWEAPLPELSCKVMHLHDSRSTADTKRCELEPEEEPAPRESIDSEWAIRSSVSTTISSQDAAEDDVEPREFRLSGFTVEVVDVDDGIARLPYSFYVRTRRVTINADCSFTTSSPVESIELSAPDQQAKKEWMKRLQNWRRYGWRETTQLGGADEDCRTLFDALTASLSARTSSRQVMSLPARTSRRRYYRATALPSTCATQPSSGDQDAWFCAHVVKTHI
ncbi:hypothetical protein PINS_up008917 [Pythium insidiosum]|nr:hypothetical protein PINS_up008917 [Pythium insidiosum]